MNRLGNIQQHLIANLDSFRDWRNQSTIEKEEMMKIVYGPNHEWRTKTLKIIKQNPNKYKHYHLQQSSREQARKSSAQLMFFNARGIGLNYQVFAKNPNALNMFSNAIQFYDLGFSIKNGVHLFLYTKTIFNLGTEKHAKFVEAAANFKDIGCFGLTEILHGSNVRGILTEAHYDHSTKQFILNSPSKDAMKFWIGAAANVANMAVIWAQLFIDGKCYGVHAYIVPIRDKISHKLLPGVLIGDCGPKNGHLCIDNGFILLDNYRIPKQNQLDRISGVDENGKFRSTLDNENKRFGVQLGALSGGRFSIAFNSSTAALSALTIAIRYVCVRRQFSQKIDQKQNLLIHYPLTKRRMMPLLAQSFIYQMANMEFAYNWDLNYKNLLNPENKVMQELHAISSCIKPKSGWFATECIKQCRQMLGGHGYSAYSKLGVLYNDNDVNNTWEGDNTVLIQQTTKFIYDIVQRISQGKSITSETFQFLKNPPKQSDILIDENFVTDLQCALKFLQYKIGQLVIDMQTYMASLQEAQKLPFDIWNHAQVFDGKIIALTVADLFYLHSTLRSIKKFKNQQNIKVVKDLSTLWILKMFREDEFIDQKHHPMIEDLMAIYCEKVSKESLGILESISACDSVIGSPFSDPEGKGFEKYTKIIMNSKNVTKKPDWYKMIVDRKF